MVKPLFASERTLADHLSAVGALLGKIIAEDSDVFLLIDWDVDPIAAGLDGGNCETVDRNRGRSTKAARLSDMRAGLWAWLGYREEWDSAPPAGSTRRFSFRTASITIFFGFKGLVPKPQALRLEWAGYAKSGGGYSFQGGNAAHPHWQIDLVESVLKGAVTEAARELASVIREEARGYEPKEFSPTQVSQEDVEAIVAARRFSRIHLANGASWWNPSPNAIHARAPDSVVEIRNWVEHSLKYLIGELQRL